MNPSWADVVVALVAVYAAIVATMTFLQQLMGTKERLSVGVSLAMVGTYGGPPLTQITIGVANVGQRAVTLTSFGLHFKGSTDQIVFPQYNCPHSFPHPLSPGDGTQVMVSPQLLAQTLASRGLTAEVKIRGFYRTATGGVQKGKWTKFTPGGWTQ